MARDEVQLTPEEQLTVWQLEWIANNTVIYKDNAWVYQSVALWTSWEVLQSNWATSAPSFETPTWWVTASWTLTADKIILGNGTTSIKASTTWISDLYWNDLLWFSHWWISGWWVNTDRSDWLSVCKDWSGNIYTVNPLYQWYNEFIAVFKSTDSWVTFSKVWLIDMTWFNTSFQGYNWISIISNRISPIIWVDSSWNLWLLFSSRKSWYTACNNMYFAFYNLWTTTWSITQITTETTSWRDPTYYDMKVSTDDVRHITWCQKYASSSTNPQLRYVARSAWTGWSFWSIENLDDANWNAQASKIVVDSNSKPIILYIDWWDSSYIKWITKASWSWVIQASTDIWAYMLWNAVVDSSNNIYLADTYNGVVRKLTTWWTWSTVWTPYIVWFDIMIDASNNLYLWWIWVNADSNISYYYRSEQIYFQKYNWSDWVAQTQTVLWKRWQFYCICPTTWKAEATPQILFVYPDWKSKLVNITW